MIIGAILLTIADLSLDTKQKFPAAIFPEMQVTSGDVALVKNAKNQFEVWCEAAVESRRDDGAEHRVHRAGRGGAGDDADGECHQDGLWQERDQGGAGIARCVGAAARTASVRAAVARGARSGKVERMRARRRGGSSRAAQRLSEL